MWRVLAPLAVGMSVVTGGAAVAQDATLTPVPVQAPSIAPVWTRDNARDLLSVVDASAREGLRPADYHPAALRLAVENGEGAALDAAAQATALALAHDYLLGRLAPADRQQWHVARPEALAGNLPALLQVALEREEVAAFYQGLLPQDRRYTALRSALADSDDPVERNRIRANMERWRWMPRGLGDNYLYVNVPSYRLEVVEGHSVRSSYTVVVGAPNTPTPWLVTEASSVVANPWWNVPQSIVKSSGMRPGAGGYVWKAAAGGWTVRQPPGPRNALGRLKINLDNDQAIYLHDTPAKSAFAKQQRALSHGCVRVKGIDQLAGELFGPEGDEARLQDALAGAATTTVDLPKRWNVYLVYFTVDRGADGRLVTYGDPYGRDADLVAKLDGSPLQIASN